MLGGASTPVSTVNFEEGSVGNRVPPATFFRENSANSASRRTSSTLVSMQNSRNDSLLAPNATGDPNSLRIVQRTGRPTPQVVPVHGLLQSDVSDADVVAGFGSKEWINRSWVHPTSIRIRARIAAAELSLSGVSKPRQAQIGLCIGRSDRTVIDHLDGFDSVFAFPPPELAPVVIDAWSASGSLDEFLGALTVVFSTLDANPTARRLFAALARVHAKDRSRVASDGHFAFALRHEIDGRGLNWSEMTRWTGFVADAFREALLACVQVDESLTGLVTELRVSLAPLQFHRTTTERATLVG